MLTFEVLSHKENKQEELGEISNKKLRQKHSE